MRLWLVGRALRCRVLDFAYISCACSDGLPHSDVFYDCNGDCNGTASIDVCGVCTGGNTTLAPNLHNVTCGCFQDCASCGGACDSWLSCAPSRETRCAALMPDACGICGGDNSTCVGCDGVPIAEGGLTVDTCNVCGGNGTACSFGW